MLAHDKQCSGRIRWDGPDKSDYSSWKSPVFYPRRPEVNLQLILIAHKRKLPRKCGFSLLLGGDKLITLDVNPGRWHKNKKLGGSVWQTHWHLWPDIEEAEADGREMPHQHWLQNFLERAHISFSGRYKAPPYEPDQMKLL